MGLFLTPRYEKAENAGNVSTSPFGYTSLIPIFFIVGLTLSGALPNMIQIVLIVVAIISMFVSYIVFRRGLKFQKLDFIIAGSSFLVGLILSITLASAIGWHW